MDAFSLFVPRRHRTVRIWSNLTNAGARCKNKFARNSLVMFAWSWLIQLACPFDPYHLCSWFIGYISFSQFIQLAHPFDPYHVCLWFISYVCWWLSDISWTWIAGVDELFVDNVHRFLWGSFHGHVGHITNVEFQWFSRPGSAHNTSKDEDFNHASSGSWKWDAHSVVQKRPAVQAESKQTRSADSPWSTVCPQTGVQYPSDATCPFPINQGKYSIRHCSDASSPNWIGFKSLSGETGLKSA